jgi:hypothetical protein
MDSQTYSASAAAFEDSEEQKSSSASTELPPPLVQSSSLFSGPSSTPNTRRLSFLVAAHPSLNNPKPLHLEATASAAAARPFSPELLHPDPPVMLPVSHEAAAVQPALPPSHRNIVSGPIVEFPAVPILLRLLVGKINQQQQWLGMEGENTVLHFYGTNEQTLKRAQAITVALWYLGVASENRETLQLLSTSPTAFKIHLSQQHLIHLRAIFCALQNKLTLPDSCTHENKKLVLLPNIISANDYYCLTCFYFLKVSTFGKQEVKCVCKEYRP